MASEKRLIDANALMKYIKENHSFAGLPMASYICTMELLTYAPTVDAVEVVHGRWEFRPSEKYRFCIDAVCTACNTVIDSHHENLLEYRQTAIKKKLLYCPNCGAKMDGESQ